jgi:hypothetical protein
VAGMEPRDLKANRFHLNVRNLEYSRDCNKLYFSNLGVDIKTTIHALWACFAPSWKKSFDSDCVKHVKQDWFGGEN